jgi:hypothetical protein
MGKAPVAIVGGDVGVKIPVLELMMNIATDPSTWFAT